MVLVKKQKMGKVLSLVEQYQLCQWFAIGFNSRQVSDLIDQTYKKKITFQVLDKNYKKSKKWMPVIAQMRGEYIKEFNKIPIASKAERLLRMEKIYKEAMTWYISSRTKYGDVLKLELGAAVNVLKAAREEMEGKLLDPGEGNEDMAVKCQEALMGLTSRDMKSMSEQQMIDLLLNRSVPKKQQGANSGQKRNRLADN